MSNAESGSIIKTDVAKQQVFGWAYIAKNADGTLNVDKSGDFIDDDDVLEKSAYSFIENHRIAGHNHKRDGESPHSIGKVIESVVFTESKIEKMGMTGKMPVGWWVGFQVTDDAVWADVEAGGLSSFSIHGKGIREKFEE